MENNDLKLIKEAVEKIAKTSTDTKARKYENYLARAIYYKIAKELTLLSLIKIGKEVNRHHATVLHALKNFDRDVLGDVNRKKFYFDALRLSNKMVNNIDFDSDLEIENNALRDEIARLKIESINNNELLEIYNQMDSYSQQDLIFKAKTILKVRLCEKFRLENERAKR